MAFFGANVAFIRSGQEGRATLGEGLDWGVTASIGVRIWRF